MILCGHSKVFLDLLSMLTSLTVSHNRVQRSLYSCFMTNATNVQDRILFGRHFFIKRDDVTSQILRGNKARKLYDYQVNTPSTHVSAYASFGGAQSNSMLALAQLASSQNKCFIYFTARLAKSLKQQPVGNYKTAISLGAQVAVVQMNIEIYVLISLSSDC